MPGRGISDPCVNFGPKKAGHMPAFFMLPNLQWSVRDMTLDDPMLNVTHSGNHALKRDTPTKIADLPVLTMENEGRLERRVR